MALYQKECTVNNPLGIHARPSSLIANKVASEAGSGSRKVFIRRKGSPASSAIDASSITAVMLMAATMGTELIVFTEKRDFYSLVDEVADLIKNMQEFDQ